jgi:pyrimidine-nucleoside phosphorylase
MRMYDIIMKKRNGGELTKAEIEYMIDGYVKGSIPDYQMSSMLMAIYFQGMSDEELSIMTLCMAHSGDMIDLSSIAGIKVDKHSTGGVGDKTTLIVAPIVAACGGKVAKMSGRGLGHTGGTVDKMEAIPNMQTAIAEEKFFDIVNTHGVSVIGQSGELAPADKKLYALRDVTATVESIPLIASSIMSKKLAAGSDAILLDVKTGSGAFMKTVEDSIELAQKMVAIGEGNDRKTVALITDMDIPLGHAIGNSLEIIEVVKTLQGEGPEDLTSESVEIAANMLYLSQMGTLAECRKLAAKAIADGSAFAKLVAMVEAQGGDVSVLKNVENFAKAHYEETITAQKEGYISHMNTEKCGIASVILGAGREIKDAPIDFSAGIIMLKKTGDYVKKGEALARFFTSKEESLKSAEALYQEALEIGGQMPDEKPLIFARITATGVERYDQ